MALEARHSTQRATSHARPDDMSLGRRYPPRHETLTGMPFPSPFEAHKSYSPSQFVIYLLVDLWIPQSPAAERFESRKADFFPPRTRTFAPGAAGQRRDGGGWPLL